MSPDDERRARVAMSFLAQPGDPVLGAALRSFSAGELLSAVTGTDEAAVLVLTGPGLGSSAGASRATPSWRKTVSWTWTTATRLSSHRLSGATCNLLLPGPREPA